jgi:glycine cleavage system protein P-like pyridoxal-binding family
MYMLKRHLMNICGLTISPSQLPGRRVSHPMAIIKHFERKNDDRNVVIVPDSAHGTNPKRQWLA